MKKYHTFWKTEMKLKYLILSLTFFSTQINSFAQWTTTGTNIHPSTTTNHVLVGTNTITDTKKPLLINSPNFAIGDQFKINTNTNITFLRN